MYQCDFRIIAEFYSHCLIIRKQREWRRKGQTKEICAKEHLASLEIQSCCGSPVTVVMQKAEFLV